MEVPSLEDQLAEHEFRYEKILLVLLCQTMFDQCVEERSDPDISGLLRAERGDFLQLLNDFETKSITEQLKLINTIPERLQQKMRKVYVKSQ